MTAAMDYFVPSCRKFTGYKPCAPGMQCSPDCPVADPPGVKILIVNMDAMGDVLMTTAQLPGIKRKYPESTIWWVTLKNAVPLLENNPYLDCVLPYDFETISVLGAMRFDVVMNADKTRRSAALAMQVPADLRLGFGLNADGAVVPFNESAVPNYLLGLDDDLKFRRNTRTGQEILAETFELDWRGDRYVFRFKDEEQAFIAGWRREAGIADDARVIGFNTGCSSFFPNKKLTVAQHVEMIERFLAQGGYTILLLGGREDEARNAEIAAVFPGRVIDTPTTLGVRKGACFESVVDVVITGDSFGMHLAIALGKHVIAWFGLTCWQEIDLYGRGVKLIPEGLDCAPCWKRDCPNDLACIAAVDLNRIEAETVAYFQRRDG